MATIKNYGDITKINGAEVEITDVVIGGSPCQDLSVAGLRKGLEGERSGLFMEQIRLIKEMREHDKQRTNRGSNEHIRPRYMVWENVCGAFSSNGGEDFRAVLEETAKVVDETVVIPKPRGKWTSAGCIMGPNRRWSIAWRVHDAQYWGVPQRRKRISLVADFAGGSAPEILFIGESVSGHIEPSREKGQGTTTNSEVGIGATGVNGEIAGCLDSSYYKGCGERNGVEREVVLGADMYNLTDTGDKAKTLTSGRQDTHNIPTVYGISSYDSNAMKSSNPNSGIYEADTSRTLDNNGGNPACNQGGMIVTENCLNPWDVQSKHIINENGVAESLYSGECRYGGGEAYVLKQEPKTYDVRISSDGTKNFRAHCYETNISRSLDTGGENPDSNHGGVAIVQEPVLLESNQDHATIRTDGIATSLPAAMGEGGGYIPMITEPVRGGQQSENLMVFENHSQDTRYKPLGDVCQTVSAIYGTGGNNQPLVVGKPQVFANKRANHKPLGDVCETMEAHYGTGGNNTPIVVEQQIAFKKKGHPQNAEQGQGWEETDKNDTLNIFDNSENRTPTLVVSDAASTELREGEFKSIESHPKDSRYNLNPTDINQTIPSIMCHDAAHGGLVMQNVEGVDAYNQTTTGDKAMSLTSRSTDAHHIPCVITENNE